MILTTVLFVGCASGPGPKTGIGTLLGATGGGLIGAALPGGATSTAAGAVLGALVGAVAGNALDQRDQALAGQATQQALETVPDYQAVPWHNPNTGRRGTVTPTRTYPGEQGAYCREFTQEAVIAGRREQVYGRACRQPDGTWKLMTL